MGIYKNVNLWVFAETFTRDYVLNKTHIYNIYFLYMQLETEVMDNYVWWCFGNQQEDPWIHLTSRELLTHHCF